MLENCGVNMKTGCVNSYAKLWECKNNERCSAQTIKGKC